MHVFLNILQGDILSLLHTIKISRIKKEIRWVKVRIQIIHSN